MIISVGIIVFIIYISLALSPALFTRTVNQIDRKVLVTAHRCGAGLAPENSITGIQESSKYHPARVEIDVHQTKDSVIVVIHDYSVDRTTNGKGKIKDLTYDEILHLSLVSDKIKEKKDEKIPTLDQIIEALNGNSKLLIEIKRGSEYYPGIEKRVIEIIKKHNANELCIIQSFDLKILEKINSIDKNLELHKLYYMKLPYLPIWISNRIEFGSLKRLYFIKEISLLYWFANKDAINCIHNSNKKANAWTVDNQEKIKKLVYIGIDGVITNYPNISQ